MNSPITTMPIAVTNTNVDLMVELPPQQQVDRIFFNRRIRDINRSKICMCSSIIAIIAIYACVVFVTPLTVFFTGVGLLSSTNHETHDLGVRMTVGGASAFTFSVMFSYCGLSMIPLVL